MNLRKAASSLLGVALFGSLAATAHEDQIGISGSGTTNPSKCFWHIMAKLEEQIKTSARLSYRAVGSGTGQKEFLGKGIKFPNGTTIDTKIAYNDFGAGDIPISALDKGTWNNEHKIDFVQLPFVLSAVTFFHNIPGVPTGKMGLNMTACLLSRVFDRDIKTWDHPDIKGINPGLNVRDDYPIYVGRRVLGSSSTYSITHYLHAQCPKTASEPKGWPEDKAASEITWHPETNPCDGSGAMTRCIEENEGAIGYIDAAHGVEAGLNEIRLKNGDDVFLTSTEAGIAGVQAAAKDTSRVPDSAFGDFSNVAYYNEPGQNTWPISLVSYIYIRKDLSHMENAASRTLLKAFATALFDPSYISLCERYGHIPVPDKVRTLSLNGLEGVEWDADEDQMWTFEKDTMPGWGQGEFVISKKRKGFGLYEADRLADDITPMIEDIRQLKVELANMKVRGLSSNGAAGGLQAVSLVWGLGVLIGTMLISLN